jgi:hypothetical protein
LTDDEFGELTPELFDALLKRKEANDKVAFIRTGIIAASIVNHSFSPPEKPVSPMDFVPGVGVNEGSQIDLTKLSPEAQAAYVLKQFGKKQFRRK